MGNGAERWERETGHGLCRWKGWCLSPGILKTYLGLPSWSSGDESTCQCRGHGFDPRSWKIPHAVGQQSPRAHVLQEKPPQ